MNDYINVNPALYSEKAYLDYTLAVVGERAIPSLKDGQKPVQRRIMFAMHELNLKHDKDPKKSARIVGDIIGKYHPHGDSAAYEALVKMSQDFYLRYPLINGQGNFGSRDGDSAAAMRYTEARLTPIADLMLSELSQGSCDYIGNYDNTITEPEILPSRLNFMLMNGTFGLAVALSTSIPAHNIRNITDATTHYIKNPKCSVEELVEHVKAPDYPTGGQIINTKEEIIKNYKDGEGFFTVRCRWKIEKLTRGHWHIVVYELPPSSSPSKLVERIALLQKPKIIKDSKGKAKKLTQKQLNDKQFSLNLISATRDESSEEEGNRVIIEPRSSRDNPEQMMNSLYKLLELEENVKMNMVAIGNDNRAVSKNLLSMISEWTEFRFKTITKRTNFSLDKNLKRAHILQGREIAFNNISEIIEIIKNEDKPKDMLIKRFSLSEIQADDILEIKLRQLAKLELDKIVSELEKLLKEAKQLQALLDSDVKMKKLMIKEMESDTKLFEDDRKTLLEESKKSVLSATDTVADENVTIIITKQGWLSQKKGHNIDTESIQIKDGDSLYKVIECKTLQQLGVFASDGRMFNIKPISIESGKNMTHINTLIDMGGTSIVDFILINEKLIYLVANENGYGFITKSSNLLTKNKSGKAFFNIKKDDKIFKVLTCNDFKYITCATSDNRILSYPIDEIKELPKGKGVQLIKLPKGVKLKTFLVHNNDEIFINNNKTSIIEFNILGKRALRGVHIKEDIKLLTE